jgi:alkylation response protein AidB-like acyl-CoA dehydrogenase
VDLILTDEQSALRQHMRELFTELSTWDVVRAAEPLGFDPALWKTLGGLGLAGMCLPESIGGDASPLLEVALVLEEAGRCAAPVPLADHLAAGRLAAAVDALPPDDLAALVSGDLRAGLAVRPAVDGVWSLVPTGAIADVVLGESDGALLVHRSEPPMQAPKNLAAAPLGDRAAIGETVGQLSALAAARDEWRVLVAAQLVGLAARALEIGVDYVKERHQFDRPVGGFQAVQHGLAELVGPIDGVRLLVAKAAWACDHDEPDRRARFASSAFLAATQIAEKATYASLHYHGGYGVTLEYDIQLLYRRARGWSLVLGDPEHELARLADAIFGPAQKIGA